MKVGICAMIKDCLPEYIQEWIEWHRLIGVDYFFIYDNESNPPIVNNDKGVFILPVLGDVREQKLKHRNLQCESYTDCINKIKSGRFPKCDWVAFIDDDEFIIEENGDLKSLLEKQKQSGLGLNWKVFGEESLTKDNTQINRYIKHLPKTHERNRHIKSIVRPEKVHVFKHPHFCKYNSGVAKNVNGQVIEGAFSDTVWEKAWINHYFCRDVEKKMKRGRGASIKPYNKDTFKNVNEGSIITDTFAIELFKILENRKRSVMKFETFDIKLVDHINFRSGIGNRHLQEVYHWALNTKGNIVEIGSFRGRSTVAMATGLKKRGGGNIYCIDPWNAQGVTKQHHIDNLKKAGCNDVVVRVQDLSWNVLKSKKPKELFKNEIGLLFIDGDHREKAVKKDLKWVSLVRKGGIIICHDYETVKILGPKFAIDDFNEQNEGVLKQISLIGNLIGNLIVFKKL
jgi:hypothetical protein